MDEALMKELEDLREENKILRDSLVEFVPEEQAEEDKSFEQSIQAWMGTLQTTLEQVKDGLRPGSDKLTAYLGRQMEENPVPLLLAAFGAGFLVSHSLDKSSHKK